MANIPQTFYDDLANPALSVVTMPAGEWDIAANAPIVVRRSNVEVDFSAAVLRTAPDASAHQNSHYPIKVQSTTIEAGFAAGRNTSRLTGQITSGTTQLVMSEAVGVTPGETVLIHAGVNHSDPAEAETYIVAVVQSVDGSTVTFTQPLGKTVTVYANNAALQSVVPDEQEYKIGTWGEVRRGYFCKGLGLDHGMERFVGGMASNVTLTNPTVVCDIPASVAATPNGSWIISCTAANNVTIADPNITNVIGSAIHSWRSFSVEVIRPVVQGTHFSKIWTRYFSEGILLSIWGGDRITMRDAVVEGTDIGIVNTEVSAGNVVLDGIEYDAIMTRKRTYNSNNTILQFAALANDPIVKNCRIRARYTGGSGVTYFGPRKTVFKGTLAINGTLLNYLDFGYLSQHVYDYISINGRRFGPWTTQSLVYDVTDNGTSQQIFLPPGLYVKGSFTVTQLGEARAISGTTHAEPPTLGSEGNLANGWKQVPPGANSLQTYLSSLYLRVWFNAGASGANTRLEGTVTYLPEVTRQNGDRMTAFAGTSGDKVLSIGGAPLMLRKV